MRRAEKNKVKIMDLVNYRVIIDMKIHICSNVQTEMIPPNIIYWLHIYNQVSCHASTLVLGLPGKTIHPIKKVRQLDLLKTRISSSPKSVAELKRKKKKTLTKINLVEVGQWLE